MSRNVVCQFRDCVRSVALAEHLDRSRQAVRSSRWLRHLAVAQLRQHQAVEDSCLNELWTVEERESEVAVAAEVHCVVAVGYHHSCFCHRDEDAPLRQGIGDHECLSSLDVVSVVTSVVGDRVEPVRLRLTEVFSIRV